MPFSGQASFCFDCEYSAQEVWGCRIVRFPSEYFREHVDSAYHNLEKRSSNLNLTERAQKGPKNSDVKFQL